MSANQDGSILFKDVSRKKNVEQGTQKAVQGMMALLGEQNVSAETGASFAGNAKNAEKAEPEDPKSEVQHLSAEGNQAQETADVRYTPDMPVEEIVRLKTFEEAGKVVVDTGVCKGQTMAEVAERRPPRLCWIPCLPKKQDKDAAWKPQRNSGEGGRR